MFGRQLLRTGICPAHRTLFSSNRGELI